MLDRPSAAPPRSSVIVPTFNRVALVKSCLDVLLSEGISTEPFEIIVVDDGSTDRTSRALDAYGDRLRVVCRAVNGGFARACNDAASVAQGEMLVFLNNDTVPSRGWLDALLTHADAHPDVGIVGSVLLYPDDSVQHAGVAIGLDGYPRHLYTGFPSDHPVVTRVRTCQAVTAASMLVRRSIFDAVGGFDTGYCNGFEDVELCLQAGLMGWQIQVCPDSVARHLESASPGRFDHDRANVERFRTRWHGRVRHDELDHYVTDGLLRVEHDARYPLRFAVSPYLGAVDSDPTTAGGLLAARARQVHALLRALVEERLRSDADLAWADLASPPTSPDPGAPRSDDTLLHHRERWLEDLALEARLAALGADETHTGDNLLAYRLAATRMRRLLSMLLPPDAICLVISRGDADLVNLAPSRAWHFPLDVARETYAGFYPADSAAAISHLGELRRRGATHLAIPRSSRWWLHEYPEFAAHLERCARLALDDEDGTILYDLRNQPALGAPVETVATGGRIVVRTGQPGDARDS